MPGGPPGNKSATSYMTHQVISKTGSIGSAVLHFSYRVTANTSTLLNTATTEILLVFPSGSETSLFSYIGVATTGGWLTTDLSLDTAAFASDGTYKIYTKIFGEGSVASNDFYYDNLGLRLTGVDAASAAVAGPFLHPLSMMT